MNEERAEDALRHLQRAAGEMIAAARAVLDVVEEVVSDPAVLQAAATAASAAAAAAGAAATRGSATPREEANRAGNAGASKVTRINVQ